MQTNEKKVWFPAKTYGWGWGLPCAWQGWVVLAVWLMLLCAGGVFLAPRHLGLFLVCTVALAIAMVLICLLKGEKPRWRWGKD
jgi:CHASE2 domain-containing sensor protein